jgi:hypothetical protein
MCGLEFYDAAELRELTFTPIGYQGAAQHTYTAVCAGFHEPGPCPPSQQPVTVRFSP